MKRFFRAGLFALGLLLGAVQAQAQTVVNHPYNTGHATHTLHSGPNTDWFNYYDAGGAGGNYLNNSSFGTSVVTFQSAPGTTIEVAFSQFSVEYGWDGLHVYDGASTAAPKIASGNSSPVCGGGSGGWWGSTAPSNAGPNVVRSTGNTITLAFCSDSSVTSSGWSAQVRTLESISLAKTVGTEAGVCAATDSLTVVAGTPVYYCYTVTNTGSSTLNTHTLVDDQLGTLLSGFSYSLAPGANAFFLSAGTPLAATTTNTATWTSGSASASDSATVTVNYSVTTDVNNPAGGSVQCVPPQVASGGSSTCTATPSTGYAFSGWSGDCSGSNPVCTLSGITRNMVATANFSPIEHLVVSNVNDPAGGNVQCVPPVVTYGGSSTCTATPSAGYQFSGWSGDCSGNSPVCTLSGITRDMAVTASFSRAAVQPIPTLEGWGLMLLAGLVGLLAHPLRRRTR